MVVMTCVLSRNNKKMRGNIVTFSLYFANICLYVNMFRPNDSVSRDNFLHITVGIEGDKEFGGITGV